MVVFCVALNCNSKVQPGSTIRFHRFPFRNKELLEKWVQAMRRDSYIPKRHHALCSLHFTEDSYLKGYVNRRQLKDDAVPSIFDFPEHLNETEHHFEESQFELGRADGRKLLKWNAVPTIFDSPRDDPPKIRKSSRKPPQKGTVGEKDSDRDSGEVAKTKWRSLRDYYRHEQRRAKTSPSGSYKSGWCHYERMHFLKDTVQRRGGYMMDGSMDDSGSFGPMDQLPVEAVVKLEYDEDEQDNLQSPPVRIEESMSLNCPQEAANRLLPMSDLLSENGLESDYSQDSKKRRLSREEDHQEQNKMMALEKLVQDNECDDLHFFKSLIPDVKDLPRYKKASLRLKIQQLICREVYGDSTES